LTLLNWNKLNFEKRLSSPFHDWKYRSLIQENPSATYGAFSTLYNWRLRWSLRQPAFQDIYCFPVRIFVLSSKFKCHFCWWWYILWPNSKDLTSANNLRYWNVRSFFILIYFLYFLRKYAETTWKKPYGKYYLINDVWPDNYRYPTYCGGACTILTSSAAQTIYNVASRIEFNELNVSFV